MKTTRKITFGSLTVLLGIVLLSSFSGTKSFQPAFRFPYKQAGLTQREAAAHLLDRFTFGPRPGDVDAVLTIGLEKWFLAQLEAKLPDDSLDHKLAGYDALMLTNAQVVNTYPKANRVLRMAISDGSIPKEARDKTRKAAYRSQLAEYMKRNGFRPQKELYRQFFSQKILRAAYSDNQLQELLTDFWFNHFNVSLSKNQCAEFVPAYERDVIRPNVLGKFEDLVLETAQSPAMLAYLDNFNSSGSEENIKKHKGGNFGSLVNYGRSSGDTTSAGKIRKPKKRGLNENYAREVMELHTLGVDGGYSQQDVTQAARVLTGWTIYPMSDKGYGAGAKQSLSRWGESKLSQRGFVHHGDFLFAANRHDSKEKTVLGRHFPGGGGYQEGVDLLKMMANHPSTAKFICRKIAVRFVNDNPALSLVEKMSQTFESTNGDIQKVLITMVSSEEFWAKEALHEKIKSPFELAISAVRSLDAKIDQPYQLYSWIARMGQRMYYYQAPTGFPDKAEYWINSGSLLNRMNFGLALATDRIAGVHVDLQALIQHREPESARAALITYCKMLIPERDPSETIRRLTPMLSEPQLAFRVEQGAQQYTVATEQADVMHSDSEMVENERMSGKPRKEKTGRKNRGIPQHPATGNNTMLGQVVGIIIGSPEFQRK